MAAGCTKSQRAISIECADNVLRSIRAVTNEVSLRAIVADMARDMGFSHFALITHEDLRVPTPGQVDIREYPDAISERIIGQGQFRRDPVIRGCVFADSAFMWSQLNTIITLDRRDRVNLEFGASEGLREGITVPCHKLGQCLGSCTFAGSLETSRAERLLGIAQVIGIFAFQRARQLAGEPQGLGPRPRLNPRPRDCVVLVGRGLSNKQIARALDLAPRTVDGYLSGARRLFGVSDRTGLVIRAMFAGEVGLSELG